MAHRVCPWWLGYFLLNPLRRFGQNPANILSPHVRESMTVLEPGPGMGFFTLELARLVGSSGCVIAVEIQPKMLARLKRRAAKAGLLDRLNVRLASPDSMKKFPDAARFFAEVAAASKPGACLLFAEPTGHVKSADFEAELKAAFRVGFVLADRPSIRRSHAALLRRT